MKIEVLPSYEHHVYMPHPYTHQTDTPIDSAGSKKVGPFETFTVPPLHLVVQYYFIKNTRQASKDLHFTFRNNGTGNVSLNFPHSEVDIQVQSEDIIDFTVFLHAVFNSGNKIKETYKGEAELGGELFRAKVRGTGSYERVVESTSEETRITVKYTGRLYPKIEHVICSGQIV